MPETHFALLRGVRYAWAAGPTPGPSPSDVPITREGSLGKTLAFESTDAETGNSGANASEVRSTPRHPSPLDGEGPGVRPSPTPLLFLHGFTGSKANWQPVMAQFPGSIALDLLGHGETESPADPARYAIEEAAADLDAFCAQLGVQNLDVCGYSLGGRLALYFALAYPQRVRRLILESASPGLASEAERLARRQSDAALAERIERDGLPAFVDYWEQIPLFASQTGLPAEIRQRLRTQRLQNNPTGLANSLRGMGTGAQPSLWPRLAELKMPVSLLAGELDLKFSAINRQMADLIANCRLEIVPNAGHTIHLEQMQMFCDLVAQT